MVSSITCDSPGPSNKFATVDGTHSGEVIRPESLKATTVRFATYLALSFGYYAQTVPGPQAQPLALPERRDDPPKLALSRELKPRCNHDWLREGPFRLVLGAGFVGGLYRHLGCLQALHALNLTPKDVVGVSAGAIVGAMYGALPLNRADSTSGASVEQSLMTLHPQDFLDPDWHTLRTTGAVCSGNALVAKLHRTFAPSDVRDLKDTSPSVYTEVYDTETGETRLLGEGCIVQAVRASAALPVLFAPAGKLVDGGLVDQNGALGRLPGERTLSHRIDANTTGKRGPMEWRIKRPIAYYAQSPDPEHVDLHFVPPDRITEATFIWDLQDPAKLERVTTFAKSSVLGWLFEPRVDASGSEDQ